MSDTRAQRPSKIIKGIYSMSIDAQQAKLAPIRFNRINVRSFFPSFPKTLSTYANSIWKTPIKPIQSTVFI